MQQLMSMIIASVMIIFGATFIGVSPSRAADDVRLPWPVPMEHATLTTLFSARHRGLDIAVPRGTPIRAAGPGRVVSTGSGWNSGRGNFVEVAYETGDRLAYFHLDTITVQPNESVDSGHVIGTVGKSGKVRGRTGVNLHLKVTRNSVVCDPLDVLESLASGRSSLIARVSLPSPHSSPRRALRRRRTDVTSGPDFVEPTPQELARLFDPEPFTLDGAPPARAGDDSSWRALVAAVDAIKELSAVTPLAIPATESGQWQALLDEFKNPILSEYVAPTRPVDSTLMELKRDVAELRRMANELKQKTALIDRRLVEEEQATR